MLASMKRAIVIAGPTGVGKTELAVRLARKLNGELISCDSVQVYRHLEIGSNKESMPDGIPQHLVDFVDLDQPFTAADFFKACLETVEKVGAEGKVPILVGGTGFYLDWIVRGRPSAPATDPESLEAVRVELASLPDWKSKLSLLSSVDPEYAKSLSGNDLYRLERALAVHRHTGNPLSSFQKQSPVDYDWRCFYLTGDREGLNRNIDVRCEKMIKRGLIRETKDLVDRGLLLKDSSPGRSIGYQETIAFLESPKDIPSFKQYLANFQAVTRQYSRRQETWFRRMEEFKWIERTSLTAPISDSLVQTVADLYAKERSDFEETVDPVDQACREKILSDKDSNRKRMKKYSAKPAIFKSDDAISDFLSNINL